MQNSDKSRAWYLPNKMKGSVIREEEPAKFHRHTGEGGNLTNDDQPIENFGCGRCWPLAADAAWEARGALKAANELIDESHFHVRILECGRCSQRFLSVFTETIDWKDGDDSQYWKLLPLTETEAADLSNRRESLTESKLGAMGPDRRCLRVDHPTGAGPTVFWARGIFVGLHD